MVQVRKGALRWSLVVAGTQEAWQATWVPAAEELRSFHAWSVKDDHVLGRMWVNLGLGVRRRVRVLGTTRGDGS